MVRGVVVVRGNVVPPSSSANIDFDAGTNAMDTFPHFSLWFPIIMRFLQPPAPNTHIFILFQKAEQTERCTQVECFMIVSRRYSRMSMFAA